MARSSNPPFPLVPSLRTILSVKKSPTSGMPARGVEGLRTGVVTFDKTIIERTPTDIPGEEDPVISWQPIAAIGAYEAMPAVDPGGEPVFIDALSRVSWWLMSISYVGEPMSVLPPPPEIYFSFRGAFVGSSEQAPDDSLPGDNLVCSPPDYNAKGLLAQVSGLVCTQFELWASLVPSDEVPVGRKIKVRIGGMADRLGSGPVKVTLGSLMG